MEIRTVDYWRKRIFLICWVAYTLAYLGRTNLSIAIPIMEDSLALDKSSLGIVGSAFFWSYAFGQLINGRLGDRFSTRKFVFAGLIISAVLNVLFGFSTHIFILTILWTLNGYFQSILWGPLMKTINRWFPEAKRAKAGLYMLSSVLVGFLLTWGCLGQLSPIIGWKGMFWIPGIVLFAYSFIWFLCMKNNPDEAGLQHQDTKVFADGKETKDAALAENSFFKLIFKSRLYLIAFTSIPLGFIREGISLWGPAMLYETFNLNLSSATGAALLIPLCNFVGVIIARLLIGKFNNNETKLTSIFFAAGILCCILLYFFGRSGIIVYLVLLAMCSLFLYGASSIITSVIPLKYHMTSSVAGFLDFTVYLGAGMSGIVSGLLSNKIGWNTVILLWSLVGAAGCICVYISQRKKRQISR